MPRKGLCDHAPYHPEKPAWGVPMPCKSRVREAKYYRSWRAGVSPICEVILLKKNLKK